MNKLSLGPINLNTSSVEIVLILILFRLKTLYAACSSILAKNRGVDEPVRVQLLSHTVSIVSVLYWCFAYDTADFSSPVSVCWNDAFRKILYCKRFKSVNCSPDASGTININHMYDLHLWNILKSLHKWSKVNVSSKNVVRQKRIGWQSLNLVKIIPAQHMWHVLTVIRSNTSIVANVANLAEAKSSGPSCNVLKLSLF